MSEQEDPGGRTPRVSVLDEQDRPVDVSALERLAEHALDAAGVPEGHSLSVALVGGDRIADLKGRYYGDRETTDVLAFPMDPLDAPAPATLGDVVICVEVAEQQARELGEAAQDEVEHLLTHGILHLAGWEHEETETESAMHGEESRILKAWRKEAS